MALAGNDYLFIAICVLSIAVLVVFSLVSGTVYKREQAQRNPYYYCDADWECCETQGCDANKYLGVKSDTYNPQDFFMEGSAFHQNCILPINNAIANYIAGSTGATSLDGSNLYPSSVTTNPRKSNGTYLGGFKPWGLGCTGPGGEGKCSDPTYNPQAYPVCPYVSFDTPPNAGGGQGGVGVTGQHVAYGVQNPANTNTINPNNWNNSNPFGSAPTAYISGYTTGQPSGNGYLCPFPISGGSNSKVTACNTQKNALYNSAARTANTGITKVNMPTSSGSVDCSA